MGKIKYTLKTIPNGVAGIAETLRLMGIIIRKYRRAPSVRELALSLVKYLPSKSYKREVAAIHAYVYNNIRYVRDVRGVETLQTPIQTIRIGQGDCDDHTMIVAALLEAIGHKTRIVAVGSKPNTYQHVFAQTKIGTKWVAVETTENWPIGRISANIKSKMIRNI